MTQVKAAGGPGALTPGRVGTLSPLLFQKAVLRDEFGSVDVNLEHPGHEFKFGSEEDAPALRDETEPVFWGATPRLWDPSSSAIYSSVSDTGADPCEAQFHHL